MSTVTMRAILLHVLGDAPVIGLGIPAHLTENGRKKVIPAMCCPGEHLTFIGEHLAGAIAPSLTSVKNCSQWMEARATSVSAYCVVRDEYGQPWCRWCGWDIDAASSGHATEQSSGNAHVIALAIHGALAEKGLHAFVVASGSGNGRHVWLLFATPQPASFANWLALRVADAVRNKIPSAEIETFPKNANPEGIGSALCLPFQGRPAGVGGGQIIVPSMPDEVLISHDDAVSPWRERWLLSLRIEETARQSELAAHGAEQEAWIRANRGRKRIESADIDLESVARFLGTITREHAGEIQLHCPRHGGNSALQVVPAKRLWICHACGSSGAGDAAAFTLTRWLLPVGTSNADIFSALSAVAGKEMAHV